MAEIHALMTIIHGISGSKYIESIERSFYNIPPLLGSLCFVLASPAAEIAFIYAKNFLVPFGIKMSFNMAIK
jgi:hypothetical protein